MLYGSYKKPRELIWLIGMLIFFVLMAEAFAGYLLPWGQMSYWGAQVIISLFGAIPVVGDGIVEFIRGDYSISDITLNRFFALHVIALPLALVGLVFVHIVALHEVGSNNPDGIEIKERKGPDGVPLDGVAFHPYHTSKDLVAILVFLMIFSAVGLSVVLPVFLPWLDRSRVKSIRYRGWIYKFALTVFVISFLTLGWLGVQPAEGVYVLMARIFTVLYFAFFLLMPYYTTIDKTKPVPERVVYHG
jgi:ubiquinol-cytochrome c reductase cytochrome b subunit